MSDGGKGGRAHERFPVDWRVELCCPDWAFVGQVCAHNASRGGLFVVTHRPPPVGARVELTVELPDGMRLPLRGTVRHVVTAEQAVASGQTPGVGVEFDPVHAGDLILLEQLATHPPEPPPPPPPPPPEPSAAPVALARTETVKRAVPVARAAPRPRIAGAVGIDLGTTFTSVAAVTTTGEIVLAADEQGRTEFPSLVYVPETGEPLCCWEAYEWLSVHPRRTVAGIKRLLGRRHDDPQLAGFLQSVPYPTRPGGDGVVVDIDGQVLGASQLAAALLRNARAIAERAFGTTIERVVLSTPVTTSGEEALALRRAVQLAGLELLALIDEPIAGALGCGVADQVGDEILAVVDFGGSSFDISLLAGSSAGYRVLASAGDPWLGGDDFDLVLAQSVADAFWRATRVELRQRVVPWSRLLAACELAKRALSEADSVLVEVPAIIEQPRMDLSHQVDRSAFEALIGGLVQRALGVCRVALARAGLQPEAVTRVIVTGGATRVPALRGALATLFAREVLSPARPEEAVVRGAALRAAELATRPAS